ncbi:MAG: cation:proton antiporter [Clostridiales bacterium]|jgi:multicomponent Na+:H+ antiporter subunit F|nr:cation:proton antiporter [Clostridiales bacterium]
MFEDFSFVELLMFSGMIFLAVAIFFCLYKAVRGPKLADRIIATNMIAIKIMLMIVVVGVFMGEDYLIDIAIVYALLSFLAVIIFSRHLLQLKLKEQRLAELKQKQLEEAQKTTISQAAEEEVDKDVGDN